MKHVVVGLALVGLGIWGMAAWWESFGLVMRGLVPVVLLGVGLVATLSGYYRLGGRPGYDDTYYEEEPPPARGRRRG